jgi:hypothetical protein
VVLLKQQVQKVKGWVKLNDNEDRTGLLYIYIYIYISQPNTNVPNWTAAASPAVDENYLSAASRQVRGRSMAET